MRGLIGRASPRLHEKVSGRLREISSRRLVSSMAKARGQAIILVVLALLVLCLGLIVLFDTGQVVSKKDRLVNTADAAAYSVAVQEARTLNLVAYMNRASVANEVAMAQMVSWYSWTNFAISATDHFAKALQLIAVVTDFFGLGEVIQVAVNALREAKAGLEAGRSAETGLFKTASTAVANLNGVYSDASLALTVSFAADALSTASDIVRLNDEQASIPATGIGLIGKDMVAANAYIKRRSILKQGSSGSDDADRLKNVVMEARDPFSRQRDGSTLFGWIKKYGGTDLVNYKNWVGLDTLDIEFTCPTYICPPVGIPPHGKKYDQAVAWGGSAGVDKLTTSFLQLARQDRGWSGPYQGSDPQYATQQHYAAYSGAMDNGDAGDLVLLHPAEGGEPWIRPSSIVPGATVGLPDYSDIVADKATLPYRNGKSAAANGLNKLDVGPEFNVLVALPINKVRTSSHVDGIGGPPDFQATDKTVSDGITALASAQVYFSRPRNLFSRLTDSRRETGNLFSPYWQARLIETSTEVRLEVAAAYGLAVP